ncbi:MAG: hypothetical protein AAGI72_24000 [Pseudomonadota bacterium]
MLINALILFLGAFIGVLVGCGMAGYHVSNARKLAAPLAFALLCAVPIPIPIPFIDIVLPLVALYVILMDDSFERSKVNKVFGVSLVFACGAIFIVYSYSSPAGV